MSIRIRIWGGRDEKYIKYKYIAYIAMSEK